MCQRVEQREGGALYVSGAPGTGKTACVTHILREMKVCVCVCVCVCVWLSYNCMSQVAISLYSVFIHNCQELYYFLSLSLSLSLVSSLLCQE